MKKLIQAILLGGYWALFSVQTTAFLHPITTTSTTTSTTTTTITTTTAKSPLQSSQHGTATTFSATPNTIQNIQQQDYGSNDNTQQSMNRRQALKVTSVLSLAASTILSPGPAFSASTSTSTDTVTQKTAAATVTATTTPVPNLDCLKDLPPVPTGYCRIFFCRHGQTENNRRRLVQGSRINIPINRLGQKQGQRIGLALANADPLPSLVFHSPLLRAQQTAEQANHQGKLLRKQQQQQQQQKLIPLASLMEVDFGPVVEGQPVEKVKPGMVATYARWAMGQVDYRPEGGGDSGRDVMERVVEAVTTLTNAAASDTCPSRCVVAFTHSAYLRILLAIFLGKSLAQVPNLRTDNGSINVLDVNISGKTTNLGPKSKLFGGWLSQAPANFQLEVPVATVVRVNEVRHLVGLS